MLRLVTNLGFIPFGASCDTRSPNSQHDWVYGFATVKILKSCTGEDLPILNSIRRSLCSTSSSQLLRFVTFF
ncbi:hypothetical protein NDI37_16560 [Funiculus sociatus GB2-A5]|uniref:Uncharacterized protein n=1 Tax=Funiculus sociatus GB2-A5 TaxID=2933946 RepID=A0ABV0JRS2_9CYAN|nr:hypothetical protein [Trichocoleus sp. FACHB-6]MBD1904986.1 hypothetical protein [Trichocoleus sp. FACHB-832]MBD2064056.1 hypothetical protein [Trichocoleus sp. FACHB-6]